MRKYFLIFFCIVPVSLFGQTDTQVSVVTIQLDSVWDHSIMESDLILMVEVTNKMYCTGSGSYSCDVLQIIKGEFSETKIAWTIESIDFNIERLNKRLAAIDPGYYKKHNIVYAGFMLTKDKYFDIKDKASGKRYNYFMSKKDLKAELKIYFFSTFLQKKLWPLYFPTI